MAEGESISDSLYAAFALYFVSPVSDAYNPLIEIARWTAALVTAVTVLYALKRIWLELTWVFKSLSKDSVAVYCDTDIKIRFEKENHGVIHPGREIKANAKSHIIMLDSDKDSLNFYEENKEKIKNKKIYIGLKEMECGLMKDQPSVNFYDINGVIARMLWKEVALWRNIAGQKKYSIAVLGRGRLGQNILNYGLLLNLFSLEQEIVYHFIGKDTVYQAVHGALQTFNRDKVLYSASDDAQVCDIISKSDLVVISEEISVEWLQVIGLLCQNGKIYYYAPKDSGIGKYLEFSNMHVFGKNSSIYTDENIRGGKQIETAKQLNYRYAEKYGYQSAEKTPDSEWQLLGGFLKWSNISSADYNEVLKDIAALKKEPPNLEELAELEHIRWCRFHYINGWQYGIPENGQSKDKEKKVHKCLCNYGELDESDKDKDRDVVREALR